MWQEFESLVLQTSILNSAEPHEEGWERLTKESLRIHIRQDSTTIAL